MQIHESGHAVEGEGDARVSFVGLLVAWMLEAIDKCMIGIAVTDVSVPVYSQGQTSLKEWPCVWGQVLNSIVVWTITYVRSLQQRTSKICCWSEGVARIV